MRRTADLRLKPCAPAATERIDPRFDNLDLWPTDVILSAFWEGQVAALAAVRPALASLSAAVDAAANRLARGRGRLVYVGAGTSGRLGALDGTELAPTFHWPRPRVRFLLAGGPASLTASAEGAEDDGDDGCRQIDRARIDAPDVVIGLAASGTTPFTTAAVARARRRGALTIAIANNATTPLLAAAEHSILLETGAEAIAGSTRMKAGTAQKVALTLFSSALMVRLGRVHAGVMVDMRATNAKLHRRATTIVAHVAACSDATAANALAATGGAIKPAILIARGDTTSPAIARRNLARAGGNVRKAML